MKYLSLKDYILNYSPIVNNFLSYFKNLDLKVFRFLLYVNWRYYFSKEIIINYYNIINVQIDQIDLFLGQLKNEIINLICYIFSYPFLILIAKLSQVIKLDPMSLIRPIKEYKYHVIFIIYSIFLIIFIILIAYINDELVQNKLYLAQRQKIIYLNDVLFFDKRMVQNFQRASFFRGIGFTHIFIHFFTAPLVYVERFLTDCHMLHIPMLFITTWVYTNDLIEPEKEMKKIYYYQFIKMLLGYIFALSE